MKMGEVVRKTRKQVLSLPVRELRLQECGSWELAQLKASSHEPQALIATLLIDSKTLSVSSVILKLKNGKVCCKGKVC